jgi:hypothetical protein
VFTVNRTRRRLPRPLEDRVELGDDTSHEKSERWLSIGLASVSILSLGLIGLVIYLTARLKPSTSSSTLGAATPAPQLPPIYFAPVINTGTYDGPTRTAASPPMPELWSQPGLWSQSAPPVVETAPAPPPPPAQPQPMTFAEARPQPPTMQTYALPNLSERTTAIRLTQATKTAYDAVLRVVGPAGSFAAFSMDPTELNRPDMPAVPTGNTVIVQSGHHHTIRLLPRQAIYGKGQAPNPGETVFASVTANEAGERVYS